MSNTHSATQPLFPLKIPPINLTIPTIKTFPTEINTTLPPFSGKQQSFKLTIPSIAPAPNKRIRDITCKKPIIYGNISHRLEGNPDYSSILASHSSNSSFDNNHNPRRTSRSSNGYDANHEWFRWTVYVRGAQNEDLSYFIDKVVFVLHETYINPIRVIESSPFEVTECGWGQFEVKIEIYFHSIPGLRSLLPPTKKRKLSHTESISCYNDYFDKNRNMKQSCDDLGYEDACRLCHEKQSDIMEMFNAVDGLPNEADSDSVSSSSSFAGYENKVVFLHSLRLFAKPDEDHSKKGIVEERYATIEFFEPYYSLYERLWMGPTKMCAYQHPFYQKYWKDRIIHVAHQEQELIEKISQCHQQLLIKMKEKKKEYDQLIAK